MGRGRAPCCDKSKVKKGPWSPAEDFRLISFIQKQGHDNWRALPKQAGLLRCGKSCRLRWINYLRPDVKRGDLTPQEEETIINLHNAMGNKWSKIASHLPGRTDNEIKNIWNTHLKKRLINRNNANCHQTETKDSVKCCSASPSPSSSSCISYGDLNSDKGPSGNQERKKYNFDQNQDSLSQVEEVLKPVEKTSSLDNCNANAPSEVQTSVNDQESKEMEDVDGIIEIPLDSDADFWSMLDGFDPIESGVTQPHEYEVSQSSNLGEDHREEVEHKKWLEYLENELGLVGGNDGDRPRNGTEEQQQLVTINSDNEMMMRPEVDPAVAYFSMWPSSPQNFGI